jgi:hypothetical protein
MTSYVRRGGLDVQPPPWLCPLARASVFALHAQPGALQQLCERTLNVPSAGRLAFKPVLNTVVLTFQDLDGLHATGAHVDQPISHRYSEACFWVMVQDANLPGSPARLLIPYYGYPKEMAEIVLPSPGQVGSVAALAASQMAAGQTSVRRAQLIACSPLGWPPFSAESLLQSPVLADVSSALAAGFDEGLVKALAAFFDMLIKQRLAFVFLRQIRGLAGGDGCDLQQVVAAHARVISPGVPSYAGMFRLCFPSFASHPIASDLGLNLAAADQGTQAIGGLIEFGFELGAGQIL